MIGVIFLAGQGETQMTLTVNVGEVKGRTRATAEELIAWRD